MKTHLFLLVLGIIIMAGGFAGYYLSSRFEWFFLAFIGILVCLGGFATYGGGDKE
jgi:hypothetical protein